MYIFFVPLLWNILQRHFGLSVWVYDIRHAHLFRSNKTDFMNEIEKELFLIMSYYHPICCSTEDSPSTLIEMLGSDACCCVEILFLYLSYYWSFWFKCVTYKHGGTSVMKIILKTTEAHQTKCW